MNTKRKSVTEPTGLDSQARLAEIMNDSPRTCSFDGTEWEIKALKPGTQWLVAEEAVKMQRKEDASFGDIIKGFSQSIPSVVKVITLCLLNDRNRIFANGRDGKFSEEYHQTYDTIMWNSRTEHWLGLLVEMMKMLDIECFFAITSSIQILRQRTLERKTTAEEHELSSQGQNGAR